MSKPTAVVVGVGAERGLGAALCRRFAQGGYHVLVAGRTQAKIGRVAETIAAAGGSAEPIAMDATRESDVVGLFERAMAPGDGFDPTELVVSNAGNNQRIDFRELTSEQFEDFWRVGCFSGFLVGREAARRLVPLGRGSIIFTGASASIRGKPGFAHFAAAKAGLRMVAQSMAREYGPLGIHVAHVVIDGGIDGERLRNRAPTLIKERGEDGLLDITRSRKLIGRFIANRVPHGRKKSTCVRSKNRSERTRASLRSASSWLRYGPSRSLMECTRGVAKCKEQTSVRCAGLSVVAILLSALASQRALSQAAASGQVEPASFANCVAELERHAQSSGVSHATTDHITGLSPDPDVLGAVQSQAEFERPIWEYLDANVSEARVTAGRDKLAEWAGPLDAIEARFGVDRHILVAIWGIESTFGAVLDDPGIVRPVVRSLVTLACGDQSRSAYWRDELMAALQMLERADVAPARMTGSWAGAMGHTQFMPTTYQKHAVDFDGDGKRDLWGASDALASTANYLSSLGWRKGQRWGFEVELPPGFDYSLADETTERPLSMWVELGLRVIGDHAAAMEQAAVLVLPAGAHGPAFLLLPNFRTILGYNTAMSYALSVAHLSDRLRGAPPFAHDWPRHERMLSSSERRELQSLVAKRGLEVGPVDGKVGPRTRAAIRAYQRSVGLAPDGYANSTLLEIVRADP